jgi:hypothetical protein
VCGGFNVLLQVVFEAAAPVGDQQPMEKQQLFPHLVSSWCEAQSLLYLSNVKQAMNISH